MPCSPRAERARRSAGDTRPATTEDEAPEAGSRSRLTVALVLPGRRGPAWLADVILAIRESGDAVVSDILVSGADPDPQSARIGRAMLRVYGWIDGRIFGRAGDPTQIVDLAHLVDGISEFDRGQVPSGRSPDLVIRLDGGMGPVDRGPAPPLGVWALVHGMSLPAANRPDRLGLAPGGPEMLLGRPLTISQLVAAAQTEARAIGQVVSGVDRLSLRRGARSHVHKLPGLVARAVSAVRSSGRLPDAITEPQADQDARLDHPSMGTGAIAIGLARVLLGFAQRWITRSVTPGRWVVAISRDRRDPRGGEGPPFRFLEAPDGRGWADPFPARTPGADLVFLEEYVQATHRGRLAVVELDDSRRGWRSVETILDLPTHLSYPFVFEWSGSWYLLPEQAATNGLQLYVAESFPGTWRWHSTALDRPAADATIAEIDGRWWMFAAISATDGGAADELHLFHAETPLGTWTAHARNPVLSDVRTARAAGRVYHHDGAWYRVAQDGAVSYGHSIAIVRIDRIDLDGYRETVVDVIRPDWAPGLVATHTINTHHGLTAVDAIRREPRISIRRHPA